MATTTAVVAAAAAAATDAARVVHMMEEVACFGFVTQRVDTRCCAARWVLGEELQAGLTDASRCLLSRVLEQWVSGLKLMMSTYQWAPYSCRAGWAVCVAVCETGAQSLGVTVTPAGCTCCAVLDMFTALITGCYMVSYYQDLPSYLCHAGAVTGL